MSDQGSLRILQLHNRQTGGGGADNVVTDEASLLMSAGHNVEQMIVDHQQLTASPLAAGTKAVWNREVAQRMSETMRTFAPDVVHVHTPFPVMSPVVFRVAAKFGVPSVATLHSYRYTCVKGTLYRSGAVCTECVGLRLKHPALRHGCYHGSAIGSVPLTSSLYLHRLVGSFATVARFIALTEFGRQILIADGFPAHRIVVKPNSVSDPGFEPEGHRSGYLVFGGRLVRGKGVDTMLKAWRILPSPPRLVIAGDGPMRDKVVEAARSTEAIDYRGLVDRSEMIRIMRGADALVFPSQYYEAGFALTLIEAFAVGTAVIASDVGNFSDLIDEDVTGRLFRSGDADALARVVEDTSSERAALHAMGRNARAVYERHYTPAINVQALTSIYRDVFDPRRSPRRAAKASDRRP